MNVIRVSWGFRALSVVLFVVVFLLAATAGWGGRENVLGYGEEDRCPVCAMRVAEHPKFACAMESDDGKVFHFCGTGCMIRSWLHPEIFLNVDKSRIAAVRVQDYFTGKIIDGHEAVWAAGSDVIGPMGPAIVPLASEKDFEAFERRHGAKHRFKLSDMTDETWERITGKKAGK